MISAADLYHVLAAVVPLYVAMGLAYGSVRWWKIFSPDQCSGINRFVALFAVPLLSFHFISTNNPFAMNYRFIAADTLQKVAVLGALAVWGRASRRGSLEWAITLFSLATLPNTLVMGIPLLRGMYGAASGTLMVQIVVLQCIIWYTLMLFLFEYRGARLLIAEQFPDAGAAASIVSFRVDSDVVSLDGREPLQTEAEVGDDGRLRVTVRRSAGSRSEVLSRRSHGHNSGVSPTPRASNLTNAEIYSLQSSRNPTPRGSSFNHTDFYAMVNGRASNLPGGSFDEESGTARGPNGVAGPFSPLPGGKKKASGGEAGNKELHMFVWSSSASPVSEGGFHGFKGGEFGYEHGHGGLPHPADLTAKGIYIYTNPVPLLPPLPFPPSLLRSSSHSNHDSRCYLYGCAGAQHGGYEEFGGGGGGGDEFSFRNRAITSHSVDAALQAKKDGDGQPLSKLGANPKTAAEAKPAAMPPASVMTRLILIMVWRKLIRNPNTYSSLLGVIWSLVSFRWGIEMPAIIARSISILSDAGLGMAMFSLGLFMALQPRIIACGNTIAAFAMAVRFLTGPAVMAATAIAVGLRGVLLHIAIVQAALPQGIVPFVFAKEYNVHPDILSTGVIFGMLIALPITL
ncbi:hypothetical protein Taro_031992, partial [Colocasia esculenta]|nr:hypothetical protein [Colocasia esculenta]